MNLLEMQPVERQVMCFTDSPHIYDIISLKQWTHLSLINKHILDKKKKINLLEIQPVERKVMCFIDSTHMTSFL